MLFNYKIKLKPIFNPIHNTLRTHYSCSLFADTKQPSSDWSKTSISLASLLTWEHTIWLNCLLLNPRFLTRYSHCCYNLDIFLVAIMSKKLLNSTTQYRSRLPCKNLLFNILGHNFCWVIHIFCILELMRIILCQRIKEFILDVDNTDGKDDCWYASYIQLPTTLFRFHR
jgi:hypothetical protein